MGRPHFLPPGYTPRPPAQIRHGSFLPASTLVERIVKDVGLGAPGYRIQFLVGQFPDGVLLGLVRWRLVAWDARGLIVGLRLLRIRHRRTSSKKGYRVAQLTCQTNLYSSVQRIVDGIPGFSP